MADVNPTISIIASTVNRLNSPVKDRDCQTGSYVYVVHYRTKSRPSEPYEKKGSVLLIR